MPAAWITSKLLLVVYTSINSVRHGHILSYQCTTSFPCSTNTVYNTAVLKNDENNKKIKNNLHGVKKFYTRSDVLHNELPWPQTHEVFFLSM